MTMSRWMNRGLVLIAPLLLAALPAMADGVFRSNLVPCDDALCAAAADASLREGKVKVDDDGKVEVEVERVGLDGATLADTDLTVCFEPLGGASAPVGTLTTDSTGSAEENVGTLDLMTATMGLFHVVNGDCDTGVQLLVTGFATRVMDADSDGISDDVDSDDDNDGIPDRRDDDDDNDGVSDVDSDEMDNDHDGILNDVDSDDDNDGIPDVTDPDDDNDGIPDVDDADPDDANRFDDVTDAKALKNAFKAEVKKLSEKSRRDRNAERDRLKALREELKSDFKDRKDDF